MKVEVTPTGMGYVVAWLNTDGTEPFRFEVEAIEPTGWGIMATVTARTNMPSPKALAGGFLTTERVNLLSSKSRHDLARRMEELLPAPKGGASIDWDRWVEQLALSIMERERAPAVPVDLSGLSVPTAQRYLVPALVPVGKATILYAAGGAGKGWFACALASAIQTGTPFLGLRVQQANVLYCDWESDEEDLTTRVYMASRGLGLTRAAPVKYVRFLSPLSRHLADVDKLVREHDIGLVILDSVGMAMADGGSGDQATEAIRFFRALRSLGAAVVAIDHIASDDQKQGKGAAKPYGSVFKWNSARNAFELLPQSEDGEVPLRIRLRHRKNNLGPKLAPIQLAAHWTDDAMRFERLTDDDDDDTGLSLDERVLMVLKTGTTTAHALTSTLNGDRHADPVNEYDVRQSVSRLMASGELHVDSDGSIRRLADEPQELGLE